MIGVKDILLDTSRKFIQAVIKEQNRKGIRASGKSADSLREEVTSKGKGTDKLTIFGEDYLEQQEHGRGPTKKAGWSDPEGDMEKWIRQKPAFSGLSAKEVEQFARAILYGQNGIHEAGSSLYQAINGTYSGTHNPQALDITALAQLEIAGLVKSLGQMQVENISSEIIRVWQA